MPYVHVRLRIIGSSQPNNVVPTVTRTRTRSKARELVGIYVLDTVDYIDCTVLNATELDGAIRRLNAAGFLEVEGDKVTLAPSGRDLLRDTGLRNGLRLLVGGKGGLGLRSGGAFPSGSSMRPEAIWRLPERRVGYG